MRRERKLKFHPICVNMDVMNEDEKGMMCEESIFHPHFLDWVPYAREEINIANISVSFSVLLFSDPAVHALQFLDVINMKDPSQKTNFFRNTLPEVLPYIPRVSHIKCV